MIPKYVSYIFLESRFEQDSGVDNIQNKEFQC